MKTIFFFKCKLKTEKNQQYFLRFPPKHPPNPYKKLFKRALDPQNIPVVSRLFLLYTHQPVTIRVYGF